LNISPYQVIRAINDYSQQMNFYNVHEAATGSLILPEALNKKIMDCIGIIRVIYGHKQTIKFVSELG